MPEYVCMLCGDKFTANDLREFKEMGESYFIDKKEKSFICPDCFDGYSRKDLEDQAQVILNQYGNGGTVVVRNDGDMTINIK